MTRTPDVVHLSWEYPPVVYGGLGRHVDALTRAQAALGRAVTVLGSREDVTDPGHAPAARSRRHGVVVLRADRNPAAAWSRPADAAAALGAAWSAVADDVPAARVLHAHDWMAAPGADLLRARWGAPLVLTVHATEHGRRQGRLDAPAPRAVHELERRAVAAADVVAVCSQSMRDEVVALLGADPARVRVVPCGVDSRAWAASPRAASAARKRWAATGPLVVVAGRLAWEKGISTVLRAMPGLLGDHCGARLVVAGRGPYEPVLRELASSLGVADAVHWAGWLPPHRLAPLYVAADAVVVPSRYEPFGLVALEAQAAGALVVAARTGGLADTVLDRDTGLTFAPGDVDALAALLRSVGDRPAHLAGLREAGRRSASARTWELTATRTEAVYAELRA